MVRIIKCETEMEAYEALYQFRSARIKFYCDKVFYSGIIDDVNPASKQVKLRHTKIAGTDTYFGNLRFRFSNIRAFVVIESAESVNRIPRNDYLLNILKKRRIGPDKSVAKVLYADLLPEESDEEDCKDEEKEEEFTLNLPFHLKMKLPYDSTIIDEFNRNFHLAICHISQQKHIGVSLEGPVISRFGKLTWVCISTRDCVFLFDIEALKHEAFDRGLRNIFETSSIKKVFHNCRFASDLLTSLYSTQLTNVFDTQVANLVVDLQRYNDKYEFNNVSSLECCLRSYLDVPPECLFKQVELDSVDKYAYYSKRPITNAFRHDLMNKTLYLILLQEALAKELLAPLQKLTGDYMRVLAKASDEEFYTIGKDLSPPDAIPPGVLMYGIQIIKFKRPKKDAPVPLARNFKDLRSGEILQPNRKMNSSSAVSKSVVHESVTEKTDSQARYSRSKVSHFKCSNTAAKTNAEYTSVRPSFRQMDEIYHKLCNKAVSEVNPSTVNVKPLDTYISNFSVQKSCSNSSGSSSSGYDSTLDTNDQNQTDSSSSASSVKQNVPEPSDIWAKIRAETVSTDLYPFQNKKIKFVPG